MNNCKISAQLQSLQALIQRTHSSTSGDIELQSHWAKYLCVLAAGFLENSLREVLSTYAAGKSNREISNFVQVYLGRIQNPKTQIFIQTAGSFSPTWRASMESFVADNGRKEAIDSIMNNRHQIAHGQHSTITIARLQEYLTKSVEVVEHLELTCT